MSDRQTEQERDAAVIARYREALVWIVREESGETVSLKTANRSREIFDGRHRDFTDAALRTIDRLTAERDAALKNESRWRERINAIIAIAESYESLAQNPAVETSVSQERLGFAQDIYQALGIGSEADHD